MEKLIKDNYDSIVKRGLINNNTTKVDFFNKIYEELDELENYYYENNGEIDSYEIADIILVCLNMAYHYNIDIEKALKQKIQINKNR